MIDFLSFDYGFDPNESAAFRLDHIRYRTIAQFIIAQKAYIFDNDKFESILLEKKPQVNHAQELLVENVNEEVWEKEKDGIVFAACFASFSQNPERAEKLLAWEGELEPVLQKVKETLRINLEKSKENA